MDEKDIFVDLAWRALSAGDAAVNNSAHEYGGFLAYHAFESTGGALCRSRNVVYPRNHNRKINAFLAQANRNRIGRQVAAAAIRIASIRNECLYPIPQPGGSHTHPKDSMSITIVKSLLRRTKGIVRMVSRIL